MASDGPQLPHRARETHVPRLALAVALLALAALALTVLATQADAEVVYDNPAAAEAPVLGFEQSGTAELGALVRLAGAARLDPKVAVAVAVDACGGGSPPRGCASPGATFPLPATLNVYAPGVDGSPGPLLASRAETFELAFEGPQSFAFELPGVVLPAEVILSLAFDTATSGYAPTGIAGPADAVAVVLAGPAAAGANPREGEGVYRAATPASPGAAPTFGFEAAPAAWEGRQPAFTVEAAAAAATAVAPAVAASTASTAAPTASESTIAAAPSPPRSARRAYRVPPSRRMTLSFPHRTARLAGPGALVQVRCTGSSAARCIGTLALRAAGAVHKAPYSIGKGRRQYVVVPLGADLRLLDRLEAARATATASTVQIGGAAVTTRRALKLK